MNRARIPSLVLASALALGALAAMASCASGSSSTAATGTPTTTTTTTTTTSAQACAEPYHPLASANTYPAQEKLPAVPGVDVASQLKVPPLDSDGDGVADTLPTDGSVGVVRSDGTVTFQSSGNVVSWPTNAGDLDGDGRDEMWISITGPTGAVVSSWVVPGTVSPGAHDVTTVGIRVNDAATAPVADRTGDGIADLMQYTLPPFGSPVPPLTTITSGTAIMAVGVPGDARSVPPVLSVPGTFVAFARLSSGPPTIITATRVQDGIEFRIGDGPRFTTAPAPDLSGGQGLGEIRNVFVSDAGTYMIGATGSRSGSEQYLWRVDRPCEPLVSPSTVVAPATPQAVAAAPQLTG